MPGRATHDDPGSRHRTRVLHLGMGWFPEQRGGLVRYHTDLHRATVGHPDLDVTSLVIGPLDTPHAGVTAVGTPTLPLPMRMAAYARAAHRRAAGIDVVDAHFAIYALAALASPRVRRAPLIFHFHGPWADEFVANGARDDWRIAARRRVERAVFAQVDAFVVLSEAFGALLRDRFGVPEDRINVIPPGVDLDRFSPGDRGEARRRVGVGDDAFVVSCVRRLVPRMGIDRLIEAFAALDVDAELVIVGEGPQRDELEALAGRCGAGPRIHFLGGVDDDMLPWVHRAADVSVVPSVALEGFGLVVLEALACGTPVVGTDVGGMGATLRQLDDTLVVPGGDDHALAARLRQIAGGEVRVPDPLRCRDFATGFGWDVAVAAHGDLVRRVLEGL